MSATPGLLIRPAQRARRANEPSPLVRLFCFASAGAGASTFRTWADRLPPWIDLASVQLPGREDRWLEAPTGSMRQFLEAIAREAPRYFDVPVAIFGHSLGALLGFEFCRLLEHGFGLPVAYLFVSAMGAPPHLSRRRPMHDLPDEAFVREVAKLEGVPDEVLANEELLEAVLPTLRADFRLYETYRYVHQPPLACPILAVSGRGDRRVTSAELCGWRRHTRNASHVCLFPGNHFYLHPCRDQLLDLIASRLAATLAPSRLSAWA